MEYLNLQRDTGIKEKIYTNLINQAEENRLKEAMESMDIQVIDAANLPDVNKPSAPKRKMLIIFGLVLGSLLSLIYCMLVYRK